MKQDAADGKRRFDAYLMKHESTLTYPALTLDRVMFGGYVVHEKGGAGPLFVSANLSEALAFIEQHIAKAGG